jgi:hypothetical protein
MGERLHEVWSVPPPASNRLRPCLRNGASWRAGVGRVRCLDFLNTLRECSAVVPHALTIEVFKCQQSFSAGC